MRVKMKNKKEDDDIYSEKYLSKYRDDFISTLRKAAGICFKSMPECNYVIVAFAQYWDDEADDAVHCRVIPSESMMSWTDLLRSSSNTLLNKYEIEISETYISNYCDVLNPVIDLLRYRDNDERFIAAFHSFCKQGCDQNDNHSDSFNPVFIFIRDKENISLKNWEDIAILT